MNVVDSTWKGRCPRVLREARFRGSVPGAGSDSPELWLTSTSAHGSDIPAPLKCGQQLLGILPQRWPELWSLSTHQKSWSREPCGWNQGKPGEGLSPQRACVLYHLPSHIWLNKVQSHCILGWHFLLNLQGRILPNLVKSASCFRTRADEEKLHNGMIMSLVSAPKPGTE